MTVSLALGVTGWALCGASRSRSTCCARQASRTEVRTVEGDILNNYFIARR